MEFQFEMENDSLDGLYLNWDSASAGTQGEIPLEVAFNADSAYLGLIVLALAIGILSVLIMFNKSRAEV